MWNDVPRGTMDEVSSHVRLNLPSVYNGKAFAGMPTAIG